MPNYPSTAAEIRQRIVARLVATSPLTDLAEGGVLATIVGAISEELSMMDMRAYVMALSHGFDDILSGTDLDDRAGQLPGQFPPRRGEASARGGNISLVRPVATAAITIPTGGLLLGRFDQPNLSYANDAPIFLDIGQYTFPGVGQDPVNLVAKTAGSIGNAPQGACNVLLSYTDTFSAASNTEAVSGGYAGEDDATFKRRALLWLASLARANPAGLESVALSFRSSTGRTARYAKLVEDPNRIGFSRLIVDDGYGFGGCKRNAHVRTGTVPTLAAGQRYTFSFDYPAVQAPSLKISRSGTSRTYASGPTADWLAIEERGVMWTNPVPVFLDVQPGDEWEISGHQVYYDYPAELQAELEANGRAAGCRVRVELARAVYVSLSGNVVSLPGYDLADVIANIKANVVLFGADIPPGEPLYMHQLHAFLRRTVRGLDNVVFDQTDKYPGDPANRIAFLSNLITLR